jgi:NAD(P)-dependent dehydrogenase (short-subunit alcohol dehydrogenase family)
LPPSTPAPTDPVQVYVVTGGSAGIGYGIVAHLLQHKPSKIYLLSAKEEHAAEAHKSLEEWGNASLVEWRQCDLQSFKQTDQVAKTLAKELDRLDALVCNAGLGVGVYNETEDGLDSHMQVNHFAQAHLALTLLPVLQKTTDSRLVFQSSDMHRTVPSSVSFASVDEINKDIGPTYLYGRSKLAQILFVQQLVKRVQVSPPWVNATHPGAVSTDQPKQAEEAYGTLGKIGVAFVRPFMADPVKQGCRSALFAATSEDVVKNKIQGGYIIPDRKVSSVSNQASDEQLGENLWNLTKKVLHSKIEELGYTM